MERLIQKHQSWLVKFLCHINAPKVRWALNEASVRQSSDHNWMLVAAFVVCISNTSLYCAASQAFRSGAGAGGQELGSDMIGTLKEPDVSWLGQLHLTSHSCQPLIFRYLKHSTVYKLKKPSFHPLPPVMSPLVPFFVWLAWGWWTICPQHPWRPFLEARLFIDVDYLNYPQKSEEYLLSEYFLVQKEFFLINCGSPHTSLTP